MKGTFQQYPSLMNMRKHCWSRLTSLNTPCPWFSVPRRQEKKWCQINSFFNIHVTSFVPCSVLVPHPDIRLSHWAHEVKVAYIQNEIHSGLFCTVRSSPNWHKGLWTFDTVGHGTLCWRWRVDFQNPDVLRSPMCSCSACPPCPWATQNWQVFHTRQGQLPSPSSHFSGWASIATDKAGAASGHSKIQGL
jgi:hypothetical protein